MDLQANGQLVKALQGLWIEEGRGTSLHSVFRTCVQLSELAAPLIFEVRPFPPSFRCSRTQGISRMTS